jgi:predicted membrane chloride channel (bestrophin family)
MVNRSRDFTRQALGYVPESQPELRSMLVRWSITYPRALMCHLRPGENIEEEVKDILKPEEVKALVASTHRPNYCMQVLTACLKEAQLPAAVTSNLDSRGCVPAGAAYRMDENLTVYSDVTGGCERILRTPVPLSYTR